MKFRRPSLGRGPRQAPGAEPPFDARPRPPFLRAMPAPLMALFAVAVAAALGLIVWTVAFPEDVAAPGPAERRPPGTGSLTHAVGEVVLAPTPEPLGEYEPPCEAFRATVLEGGAPGVARLTAALRPLCTVAGRGVAPELSEAVRGLGGARIRFARFARTGVESAADMSARRVLLNLKFAKGGSRVDVIGPVLAHEGWHLANADGAVTAEDEYRARTAELEACRQLIRRDEWPRGCLEAEGVLAGGREAAVARLTAAGYPAR